MTQQILLSLTFVFGVLRLFTFTKLFNITITGVLESIFPSKKDSWFQGMLLLIGQWFFYFSLIYQSWYWLFNY